MTCAIIEYDSAEKTIYIQQISRCSDSEISSIDKRGEQGSGHHIMSKMKEVFFDFSAATPPIDLTSSITSRANFRLTVENLMLPDFSTHPSVSIKPHNKAILASKFACK